MVRMGMTVDTVAGTLEALGHELLGLAGIEIHLKPATGGDLLQGELGADEIEWAGSAAQIELSGRFVISEPPAQPNSPPNRPLLWGCFWPFLVW